MHVLAKLASKLPRIVAAFQAFNAYLKPEAFEQRERDRQRAQAVETLETIQRTRQWCDGAEQVARGRLDALNQAELGLDTPAMRGQWSPAGQPPARLKFADGDEYVQVPRTRREIYGHDAAIEPDDDFDFWVFARAVVAFALGALGALAVGMLLAHLTS